MLKSKGENKKNTKEKTTLIARGSIGTRLLRGTIQFAKERVKAKDHKKNQRSERLTKSEKQKNKESFHTFGCLKERKAYYEHRGKWTKCKKT